MVAFVLIFLLCLLTFYAYTEHNSEFTATASAIRQIWSGTCRLSCRQTEYSGFEGFSGLAKGQEQDTASDVGHGLSSGPSIDCVCESCPCALVDNVLRTCRPATYMYNKCIESVSNGYYDAMKTLYDNLKYKETDEGCDAPSQKRAQLINQLDSFDNINFVNQTAVRAEKQKPQNQNHKNSSNLSSLSKMKLAFRRKSDAEVLIKKTKDTVSPDTAIPNADMAAKTSKCCSESDNSAISEQSGKSCSKCIEKGKICINNCPRAYEQGSKKEKK